MEYTLVYKCRRCGARIEITDTDESIHVDGDVARVIRREKDLMFREHECNLFPESTDVGIADLVGFNTRKEMYWLHRLAVSVDEIEAVLIKIAKDKSGDCGLTTADVPHVIKELRKYAVPRDSRRSVT